MNQLCNLSDITFKLTVLAAKPAPKVTHFSSRGPNMPDVIAPRYNILAEWASNRPIQSISENYFLLSDYALLSGTSMKSPHAVGVAALTRAAHPEWSPAAVRSAMMTTASSTDNTHGPILDMDTEAAATPLDNGAGHIDPNKAMDPGLVYDIEYQDYVNFLCGLNYTSEQIKISHESQAKLVLKPASISITHLSSSSSKTQPTQLVWCSTGS
ncbi:hypothetical protein ACLOJK_001186 [Asimina triloba]